MKEIIKTCLICEHCDLNLGSPGHSEMTPGTDAWFECLYKHFERKYDHVDLSEFVRTAEKCPDFELHKGIKT